MRHENLNLADVLQIVESRPLKATDRRDMVSAVNRLCEVMGGSPGSIPAAPALLRPRLNAIRPAYHRITTKTFSNLKSLLLGALQLAGLADRPRGVAKADPAWAPLALAIADDKRMVSGLAAIMNFCAMSGICPEEVNDQTIPGFHVWLETRTLCPKPTDVVCRVPRLWNEAAAKFEIWPAIHLETVCFRPPRLRRSWDDLPSSFCADANAYLKLRAEPDLFDETGTTPIRGLATSTLHLLEEQLRLAASVLMDSGTPVVALADLVEVENFKAVLRHYHDGASGEPNSFANGMAQALLGVARYHADLPQDQLSRLKALAARLPALPVDLSSKNQALLRQLDADEVRARLLLLPEKLHAEVKRLIAEGTMPHVLAQMALVIDLCLVAPLRPQNLCVLDWSRHFLEPAGPQGPLRLFIPKNETKTKRQDLTFELPPDVAKRVRWYRREILGRLGADPNGPLLVREDGGQKAQETISQQITEAIGEHVGVHMTPHQFRHFAASLYLRQHPEDLGTVQALLGHASLKTTLIYAGWGGQRANKVFNAYLVDSRDKLKLAGRKPARRGRHLRKKDK